MKKLIVLTILCLFVFYFIFGQNQDKYSELIKTAWSLYESKEYFKSGEKYSEAFVTLDGKGMVNDRYNAACSTHRAILCPLTWGRELNNFPI